MKMIEDVDNSDKEYFNKYKQRDYKCPCGKGYLSYAALFTHIKQKHQGKVTFLFIYELFSHQVK
jgi:hypothetical protein